MTRCLFTVFRSLGCSQMRDFFFLNKFIYCIYLFLAASGLRCWGELSLVAASGGYSSSWCAGFSLLWLLLLWNTGSLVVARGLQW